MDARLTKGTKEGSQSTEHPSYDKSDAEPAKSPSIRVFLLLESRLLRDILARVIRRHGLEPMACSAPAETAAEDVIKSECDVLLLDFIDPGWLSTIKVCSERNKKPIRIVAIDMGDSRETFLEAVRRGVTGYVLNSASAADIVSAVRLVANGEAICSPQLQALLFREVGSPCASIRRTTLGFVLNSRSTSWIRVCETPSCLSGSEPRILEISAGGQPAKPCSV